MAAVNAKLRALPSGVHRIQLAVPYLGTVNVWLLAGDPLTLVDTGPANDASRESLEAALHALGHSIADIELVLLTHHHLDHSGLAGAIAAASGARIAATAGTAAWGSSYHERAALEAAFGRRLLAEHGVPPTVIESSEAFWEHIIRNSANFTTTDVLGDGDVVRAGGRGYRVVERPGHSVTDTLFVERRARRRDRGRPHPAGDHLGSRGGSARALGEYPAASAPAVPRRAPRHGGDGARRASARPRARDPRSPAADQGADRVPRTAARARRRFDRRARAARRSRSRSACGTRRLRGRRPSS